MAITAPMIQPRKIVGLTDRKPVMKVEAQTKEQPKEHPAQKKNLAAMIVELDSLEQRTGLIIDEELRELYVNDHATLEMIRKMAMLGGGK